MEAAIKKTAVFIDGDWLLVAAKQLQLRLDFDEFLNALHETYGSALIVRIYLSVASQSASHATLAQSLTSLGYHVVTVPVVQRAGRTTAVQLDVQLAVDAIGMLPILDRLVLISGDSDFVPMLRSAKERGCTTVLVALPFHTGQALKSNSDQFATIEDLLSGEISAPETDVESAIPSEIYIEKGDHFQSYLQIRKLVSAAKRRLLVVDPYLDDQILLMVKLVPTAASVTMVTKKVPVDFCTMVSKLRQEKYEITIFRSTAFHDRFLAVDDSWWHSGHSFKDLGSRDSRLSKLEDTDFIQTLSRRVAEATTDESKICT